jgi:hypothetical protein
MDNPEKLATLGTQDTGRRQTKLRAIKNGQSRETGNIGYTRYRTKTNKTKIHYRKLEAMSNTDPPKTGGETMCSRTVSSSYFLQETRRVTYTYSLVSYKYLRYLDSM